MVEPNITELMLISFLINGGDVQQISSVQVITRRRDAARREAKMETNMEEING